MREAGAASSATADATPNSQDKDVGQGAVSKGNNEMANYVMYALVILLAAVAIYIQKMKDGAM